jgi:hypothetical protein
MVLLERDLVGLSGLLVVEYHAVLVALDVLEAVERFHTLVRTDEGAAAELDLALGLLELLPRGEAMALEAFAPQLLRSEVGDRHGSRRRRAFGVGRLLDELFGGLQHLAALFAQRDRLGELLLGLLLGTFTEVEDGLQTEVEGLGHQ